MIMRIATTLLILIVMVTISIAKESPREIIDPVTIDEIGDFIKDLGYSFDRITTENPSGEVGERIVMDIEGENGNYTVGIEIYSDVEIISIYVEDYLDLPLENPSCVPMLSYLMNENWKLTFGNFAWNISTGEVRLCHTLPIDDGISTEVFGAYLSSIVSMADEKYPEYFLTIESFSR